MTYQKFEIDFRSKAADRDTNIRSNLEQSARRAMTYDFALSGIFNPVEQTRLRNHLKQAKGYIQSDTHRALDIGMGTGNVTEKLLELGFQVVGVELSPEMIDVAKRKFPIAIREGKLQIYEGDAESVLASEQLGVFDIVCTFSVLHHAPDLQRLLEKMVVSLAPGGVLYLDHEMLDIFYWPSRDRVYALYQKLRNAPIFRVYLYMNTIARMIGEHGLSATLTRIYNRLIRQGSASAGTEENRAEHYVSWDFILEECQCLDLDQRLFEQYLLHWGKWRDYPIHPLFAKWCCDCAVYIGRKPFVGRA